MAAWWDSSMLLWSPCSWNTGPIVPTYQMLVHFQFVMMVSLDPGQREKDKGGGQALSPPLGLQRTLEHRENCNLGE